MKALHRIGHGVMAGLLTALVAGLIIGGFFGLIFLGFWIARLIGLPDPGGFFIFMVLFLATIGGIVGAFQSDEAPAVTGNHQTTGEKP